MAAVKATKNGSKNFSQQVAALPHLLTHGLSGEVKDVRADLAATLTPMICETVDEFTAPATGSTLTLSFTPMAHAGATLALHEVMDGALISPPTGTLTQPGGGVNPWVYTPAAAPNGTHNYAVWYEFDGSQIANASVAPAGAAYAHGPGTGSPSQPESHQ